MSSQKSTGKRVFSVVSIIMSVLVIILAATVIIGAWMARGTVIDVATGVLGVVDELAGVGREGADRLDTRLTNLQEGVDEITAAVDEVAQNVEDKGLVMTLLPPEKEQKLINTAEQISDGVDTVKGAVEAAAELKQAIDKVPFVNLPQADPERIEALEEGADEISSSVDEIANDIQQFREGSSEGISKLAGPTTKISNRLNESKENLAQLDGRLEELQNSANQIESRISFYVNAVALLITLVFGWGIYALVMLILRDVAYLRGPTPTTESISKSHA